MTFPYKIGYYFKDQNQGHITGVDFDRQDSNLLVACSDDGSVCLYDCLRPQFIKTVKAEGASLVRFTHHPSAVLIATSGKILYSSLHDNQVLRKYSVGESQVSSLGMSPTEDVFLASADKTTLLFDLRSSKAVASLSVVTKGANLACYDPQGQVFAVATDSRVLRLYDSRNYDKGPFASFEVVDSYRPDTTWSDVVFSPDGSELLISTKQADISYVLDSFEGQIKNTLASNFSQGAAFSADNRFIAAGCQDGSLAIWNRDKGFDQEPEIVEAHHRHVSALAFNHRYNMFVSACTFLAFWIPGN